jgi:probable rRNA maturation factor
VRKVGGEGDPEVFVADEQQAVPIDTVRWASLAEAVLVAEGVRGNVELSLLFVAEDDIAELNREFLGKGEPTDVLAFPIDAAEVEVLSVPAPSSSGPDRSAPDPGDLPLLLGDVVVCPAVAERQAPTHAGTLDDELALLVVHGVLHVLGHDHAEPDERARMRARERALLEAHHWRGPTPGGFRQEHD